MIRFVCLLLCLLVSACGTPATTAIPATMASQEALVREYVMRNAKGPDGLEFASWGPHMLDSEIKALAEEVGVCGFVEIALGIAPYVEDGPVDIIRLTYKDPHFIPLSGPEDEPVLRERLFAVTGARTVVPLVLFMRGEQWKQDFRAALGKQFPNLKK